MRKIGMFPPSKGPLKVAKPEAVIMGNDKSMGEGAAGRAGAGINRTVREAGGQHGLDKNPKPLPRKPMVGGF